MADTKTRERPAAVTLTEAAEAHRDMEKGSHIGKFVLVT